MGLVAGGTQGRAWPPWGHGTCGPEDGLEEVWDLWPQVQDQGGGTNCVAGEELRESSDSGSGQRSRGLWHVGDRGVWVFAARGGSPVFMEFEDERIEGLMAWRRAHSLWGLKWGRA